MKEAFKSRLTSDRLFVARFHYAADSQKDPTTPEGRKWLDRALVGYPGGMQGAKWRKEMEIDPEASASGRAIPHFYEWVKNGRIICDPGPDITGATLYGSYDHGYANPACYLVHAIWPDGMRRTIWEVYGSYIHPQDMAKVIRGQAVTLSDGRHFEGNPYAGKEVLKICDPEIDRRTSPQSDGTVKKVIEFFRDGGVHFIKGERGNDLTVLSWLLGTLWQNPLSPSFQIASNCRNLISEFGGLEHLEISDFQALVKNKPEGLKDKDNHAWDAWKYFMMRFPVVPNQKPPEENDAGSFEWWKKMAQKGKAPKHMTYSFQRSSVR